ncbi:MAG: flagellar hook protein FlgE [Hyphomicrobiales bacterium]|nr:flagellar hook protein FlgE [Hyphomicrobiales bacterium]
MTINGVMRTAASGMAAQGYRLATVADNIANTSTTGYKRASTEFSSLVVEASRSDYVSGGVETDIRYAISQSGVLAYTDSGTDLAINGEGFFVVADPSGQPFLTRAGSFELTAEGTLVNAAGYTLMGYNLENGTAPVLVNGFAGLEVINIGTLPLVATPSTEGTLYLNLPAAADIVAPGDLPSLNLATSDFTAKSSIVAHDNLGTEVVLDVYFTKTADETWEVSVYDQGDADAGGDFPYSSAALVTTTLTFDAVSGQLDTGSPISIPVPNGQSLVIDMSQSTQLDIDYAVLEGQVNGNPASDVANVTIAADGTVNAVYDNGQVVATHIIPIATVPGVDFLDPVSGNVFSAGQYSGDVVVGFAGTTGLGTVVAGALEQSNADLANELTTMIEAQRSYTVNTRVFQTGADLLDVLVNLVR